MPSPTSVGSRAKDRAGAGSAVPEAENAQDDATRGGAGPNLSYGQLRELELRFGLLPRRLAFDGPIERAYRSWNRSLFRMPRILLLLSLAVLFGTGPLYQRSMFQMSDALAQLFIVLDLAVVVPVLLLAALSTIYDATRTVTQALQTAAMITTLGATLLLHIAALHGELNFPPQILGLELIAIAFFGGFSWDRIVLATLLFFAVRFSIELHLASSMVDIAPSIFTGLAEGSIAVFGAYAQERISRTTWLRRKMTQVLLRTDVLTGLGSRFEFDRALVQILRQARREQRTVAVLLIDVDHFKRFNDTHGHLVGDHVLRAVGQAISRTAGRRALDLQARFGGEEMVVVWYDPDVTHLHAMASEVLDAVRAIELVSEVTGERLRVTASGGLTWATPDEQLRPEPLLQAADQLLYQAKHQGRDRIVAGPFAKGVAVKAISQQLGVAPQST